jgi:hypothetical protein
VNTTKILVCQVCGAEFEFSLGEQRFFTSKHLARPAKCRPCRQEAREKRERKHQEEKAQKQAVRVEAP